MMTMADATEEMAMAKIIDGREISRQIRKEIVAEATSYTKKYGLPPSLAVIIVGNDPASSVYVKNKKKACEEVGFHSEVYELEQDTKQAELIALIDRLNNDRYVHGILVQLPLPKHLDSNEILLRIDPKKDVDAFHPYNVGKIMTGNYDLLPCTPSGIMTLLERSQIDICGKNCVVVGRSNIVGKPMAMLLLQANGTVTVCHSKTKNLGEICRNADILIASVGHPEFINGDMVKNGAVVVDVGINRLDDGRLVGDVNFSEVEPKASYITPVPGGVGPMTITMLLKNTLTASVLSAK